MGKAITYMLVLWKGLTSFLDDPPIALENNAAERALRGVVVGRKYHYGSKSKRGTEVAAIFYTLFETAKLSQVEPSTYVTQAALPARSPLPAPSPSPQTSADLPRLRFQALQSVHGVKTGYGEHVQTSSQYLASKRAVASTHEQGPLRWAACRTTCHHRGSH